MPSKNRSITFTLITFFCACSINFAHAQSEPAEASDPTVLLTDLLANVKTLSADVTQHIIESDGGILESSEIKMQVKRPNGFSWETLNPYPELIVTNGEKLWNYQPDLEQVVVETCPCNSELTGQLLNGKTDELVQDYDIVSHKLEADGDWEFELRPLAADSLYQQITLTFFDEVLTSIHIDSTNGQKTLWQFENIMINQSLSDSVFDFVPPAGIEVIENSYIQ